MNFTTPEFIDNTFHDCKKCGVHVTCGRASSWEFEICPKCYDSIMDNKRRMETDLMSTVVSSVISPMTLYLNRYTPLEMERMKKMERMN